MAQNSVNNYPKFVQITMVIITGFFGIAATATAQSSVLIEGCNALKVLTKKRECLNSANAALTPDKKDTLQPAAIKQGELPPFSIEVAAASCEAFLTGMVKRRLDLIEDVPKSTAAAMSVMWPGVDSNPATYCAVDRKTRKIVSVTIGGKYYEGAMVYKLMASLDATNKQVKEFSSGNYSDFVMRAKASLTQDFKDPASAQYKSLFISGDKLRVLCGEVNAKNSYGAYVGFRRFYATGEQSLNAVEPTAEATVGDRYVFDRMWPKMCGERQVDIDS